jgi:hypothetical protein
MRPAVAEVTSGPAALLHHHPRLDLSEGIPQQVRFLILRRLWRDALTPGRLRMRWIGCLRQSGCWTLGLTGTTWFA